MNVEHLLDIFTTIDTNSNTWDVCGYFMEHLAWHKRRLVVLGPKIEGLPDNHRSKPECLLELSLLFESVGNKMERKRLLVHTLKLWRERRNDFRIADTLGLLSDANRMLGLYKEGIDQAREALEIYKRLNNKSAQAHAWNDLVRLLHSDGQLDAAEEAASRAINLLSDKGDQSDMCQSHRFLGNIYRDKAETEKAINHYETAPGIATSLSWHGEQFWIHYSLARLFSSDNRFYDAHTHVKHAKSRVINDPYCLGCAMQLQAGIWQKERKFEEAKSEALRAADVFEKLGATKNLERCRGILRDIEAGVGGSAAS